MRESMELLAAAHRDVGGDIVSAGGTGSYDLNERATEIQAGSYALMDTAYAKLGLPFGNALTLLATVISVNPGWVGGGRLRPESARHGPTSTRSTWERYFSSARSPRKPDVSMAV